MSAAVALQAALSGLAIGSVYGLVGLGFTLVQRLTRVLNLAHGDVVVGAVFAGVYAALGVTPVALTPSPGRSALLVGVALLVGALLAVALYFAAVRPFLSDAGGRRAGDGQRALGWIAATLAAGLLVRECAALVFPREAYTVPDPLRLNRLAADESLRLPGGQVLPVRLLGVLALGLVAGLVVERVAVRSRAGKAMRAVADDPDTARLLGIDPTRAALAAFAIAGVLAGLAGVLIAPSRPVAVSDGVILGLKGIAAALVGGLGSLRGAIAGGLLLGVLESLATSWSALGPAYHDVLPLTVLVVVLAARPQGAFRRVEVAVE